MKITIEMVGDEFKYGYEVGKSNHHGTHPVTPESLQIFVNVMTMCRNSYINQHEEFMLDARAKAWLEKHPEIRINPTVS